MSILSNKDKGGNSSKFALNHQILNGLQSVSDNTSGLLGALISILNATVAHQDMEILLVRDTGNGDVVVQQIREYDETTQTWSTTYTTVTGAPYTPVGPLEYLDPSAVLNLILTEMLDQGLTLDDIETNTDDVATQTTLLAFLAAFAAEDFSTETTQLLVNANLTLLNTKLNTLGQKASAASAPVVLSTEQEAILSAISIATGLGATEATLLLANALLTTIDADTSAIALDTAAISANIDASTWDTTIGNTKTFSYYAGTQPGHPATSTTEVRTIAFSDGGGLVFTQTFTYDAANNVLTIVVT